MDPRRDEIETSSSLSSSTSLFSTYDYLNLPFGFSSLTSHHVVSIDVDEINVNNIVDSGD